MLIHGFWGKKLVWNLLATGWVTLWFTVKCNIERNMFELPNQLRPMQLQIQVEYVHLKFWLQKLPVTAPFEILCKNYPGKNHVLQQEQSEWARTPYAHKSAVMTCPLSNMHINWKECKSKHSNRDSKSFICLSPEKFVLNERIPLSNDNYTIIKDWPTLSNFSDDWWWILIPSKEYTNKVAKH